VGAQGGEQAAEAAAELKEHIDVEAAPPASEVLSAMGSMTRSAADDPWMRHGQGAWRLIILFQHNLPILQQAVDGYVSGSTLSHFRTALWAQTALSPTVFHYCACLCLAMSVHGPHYLHVYTNSSNANQHYLK